MIKQKTPTLGDINVLRYRAVSGLAK